MPYSVQEETLAGLDEEWQRLLPHCSTDVIFLTSEWQRAWWQEFGRGNELLLLSIREKSRLAGIAPLVRRDDSIHFLGDPEICDYLDFAVTAGEEAGVYAALLGHLSRLSWKALDLHGVSSTSPTGSVFVDLARSRGYRVEVAREEVCPVLDLPGSWEEYLASLDKKDRHELERKVRRLSQRDFRYYAVADNPDLRRNMEDFLRLHRESREDKARFMTPEMAAFFTGMAGALAKAGHLKLFFLEVDGLRVSTALCFDYRDELLLYNSGYDTSYSWYAVGLLLKAFCVKEAIALKKKRFNFLRGAEPYKHHLGGKDQPVYHVAVSRERQ